MRRRIAGAADGGWRAWLPVMSQALPAPAKSQSHITLGVNLFILDSRRVFHPAPESAGRLNTSHITSVVAGHFEKGRHIMTHHAGPIQCGGHGS